MPERPGNVGSVRPGAFSSRGRDFGAFAPEKPARRNGNAEVDGDGERLLNMKELAAALRVSRQTVHRLLQSGAIDHGVWRIGRRRKYSLADVKEQLAVRRIRPFGL